MNIDQLFEITKLPIKSKQRSNIPKNAIYPQLKKTEDKDLIQDSVQSIYLLAILNEQTTNLAVYESDTEYFNEIFLIHVHMREKAKEEKIFNLLTHIFPYPIVVVFNFEEYSTIHTGKYDKRLISGVPSVKVTKTYSSKKYSEQEMNQLFERINLNQLTQRNFKELYLWIQENILGDTLNFVAQENSKPVLLSADERDEINQLEKDIDRLKIEIKREEQINKIIPLQYELNNKKERLKKLIKRGE
ncbi:DUF4391 domain-containing protein [Aerococcus urinaeequi]|uniref:DUF4391 domain-containing protein n=1 Tax=Aerococcus urinaeequi TaxID=51665 RepID=A0AA47GCS1_9LACT|nr:DUF4391 domain-containing protein [Aerococcus urinaeequi]WAT25340.1 DUF4391 domain-containing protein [Aerococcus urinaeequi]